MNKLLTFPSAFFLVISSLFSVILVTSFMSLVLNTDLKKQALSYIPFVYTYYTYILFQSKLILVTILTLILSVCIEYALIANRKFVSSFIKISIILIFILLAIWILSIISINFALGFAGGLALIALIGFPSLLILPILASTFPTAMYLSFSKKKGPVKGGIAAFITLILFGFSFQIMSAAVEVNKNYLNRNTYWQKESAAKNASEPSYLPPNVNNVLRKFSRASVDSPGKMEIVTAFSCGIQSTVIDTRLDLSQIPGGIYKPFPTTRSGYELSSIITDSGEQMLQLSPRDFYMTWEKNNTVFFLGGSPACFLSKGTLANINTLRPDEKKMILSEITKFVNSIDQSIR